MLAHKTGVALFSAKYPETPADKNPTIAHFAFQVSKENFQKLHKQFDTLGIPFNSQDHPYFHSIYIKDLDGHTVELSTLKAAEKDFNKLP